MGGVYDSIRGVVIVLWCPSLFLWLCLACTS